MKGEIEDCRFCAGLTSMPVIAEEKQPHRPAAHDAATTMLHFMCGVYWVISCLVFVPNISYAQKLLPWSPQILTHIARWFGMILVGVDVFFLHEKGRPSSPTAQTREEYEKLLSHAGRE